MDLASTTSLPGKYPKNRARFNCTEKSVQSGVPRTLALCYIGNGRLERLARRRVYARYAANLANIGAGAMPLQNRFDTFDIQRVCDVGRPAR